MMPFILTKVAFMLGCCIHVAFMLTCDIIHADRTKFFAVLVALNVKPYERWAKQNTVASNLPSSRQAM